MRFWGEKHMVKGPRLFWHSPRNKRVLTVEMI